MSLQKAAGFLALTVLTGMSIQLDHASAQSREFRLGEWSDWGEVCYSPVEWLGAEFRSRADVVSPINHDPDQFFPVFIDTFGHDTEPHEGESAHVTVRCYNNDGSDVVEVTTDFRQTGACPEDHPYIRRLDTGNVEAKCQIGALVTL